MKIGDTVSVPSIKGTITRLVSTGLVEAIRTAKSGDIVWVRLRYGRKINQVLPFKAEELNTKERIYR
jgi:hypothetical protein